MIRTPRRETHPALQHVVAELSVSSAFPPADPEDFLVATENFSLAGPQDFPLVGPEKAAQP